MANLSLKQRRGLARGISLRTQRFWGTRKHTGDGNRSKLTTNIAGANNDLFFFAKTPGVGGNSITITYAVGGTTPVVSVAGKAITVTAQASTTAREIARAIRFHPAAGALVHVNNAPGNDGTGTFAAAGPLSLTGAV